jgi:alpha-beta hydrolase superfamily lysophospholipase
MDHAAHFALPLLVMHGSADRTMSPEASREFAAKVSGDCTFKLWEGLYHDICNEPEQQDVFDLLAAWLEAHTPA